ncbi:hypothetical protein ABZ671_11020 [Micromonospora sp. NPDC006766]|uniref:hypothetical protein n=1 Tax=Micromonospora sp. NPDC006766 TaxID=3154778 RepID=UPI0033C4A403
MPAPVAPAEKRTPSLLTVLFWVGVGLAPLAALILLVVDDGGALRIGAVLAILAVVLIGLSIALRSESGDGAAGTEELREEIAQLRHELHSEIVAAAHRGNEALDQARRAQETVTALRRRLDVAAAGMAAAAGSAAPVAEVPAGGRARVPAAETYDEGRSRHRAAPESAPIAGGQPAGWGEDDSPRRPQPGTHYGADRPRPGGHGASRAADPDARPVGVVHHTETVHVTTRHTIVDGGPRLGYREPMGDRDRSGVDRDRPVHGRSGAGWPPPDVRARTAPEPSGHADDPDGDYWSELRAGNRWASVRDDERGREIRVGERHAAVHAAEAGAEYRVEDRWASVREPRRDHGASRAAGPGWAEQRSGQPEHPNDEPYNYPPPPSRRSW